jgi:hypothetical protein
MIIAFAIIALIIISGLSIGIYAVFIPFMQNISDIQSYNTAYYGAIAATERALLVTKQQQFWFNGSWWQKWSLQRWPASDFIDPAMGAITQDNNGIQREITGITNRIPQAWQGNIPQIFAADDSANFNSFGPQDTIFITTNINNNSDPESFYTQTNDTTRTVTAINTRRRIPPHIQWQQGQFSVLDQTDDNIIVLRQRRWRDSEAEFSIIPTTEIFRGTWGNTIGSNDMHIRSSVINTASQPVINFANNYNPIQGRLDSSEHSTFWPGESNIKNIAFSQIFARQEVEELYLQYAMAQSPISQAWFIYPFLEYAIQSDGEISDTHRHIQWQSTVGGYEVKIQIKKPQNENIKWSNFTIVF